MQSKHQLRVKLGCFKEPKCKALHTRLEAPLMAVRISVVLKVKRWEKLKTTFFCPGK